MLVDCKKCESVWELKSMTGKMDGRKKKNRGDDEKFSRILLLLWYDIKKYKIKWKVFLLHYYTIA